MIFFIFKLSFSKNIWANMATKKGEVYKKIEEAETVVKCKPKYIKVNSEPKKIPDNIPYFIISHEWNTGIPFIFIKINKKKEEKTERKKADSIGGILFPISFIRTRLKLQIRESKSNTKIAKLFKFPLLFIYISYLIYTYYTTLIISMI